MRDRVETQEYQVTLQMNVGDDADPETAEGDLDRLVTVLTDDAAGLALGPAGAIRGGVLELLFTVKATDAPEMYSKLHDIAVILRDRGEIDFSATSAHRGDRELVPA